jgi:hypothetical protein
MMQLRFRAAEPKDAELVLQLVESQDDIRDRLMIPPRIFRREWIEKKIKMGLWLAEAHDSPSGASRSQLVGMKTLYFLTDPEEREKTLRDELRIFSSAMLESSTFTFDSSRRREPSPVSLPPDTIYLYSGSDYTVPEYRRRGVNKKLTQFAMGGLAQDILRRLDLAGGMTLACVCGVVCENKWHGEKTLHSCIDHLSGYGGVEVQDQLERLYASALYIFDPDAESNSLDSAERRDGIGMLLVASLRRQVAAAVPTI